MDMLEGVLGTREKCESFRQWLRSTGITATPTGRNGTFTQNDIDTIGPELEKHGFGNEPLGHLADRAFWAFPPQSPPAKAPAAPPPAAPAASAPTRSAAAGSRTDAELATGTPYVKALQDIAAHPEKTKLFIDGMQAKGFSTSSDIPINGKGYPYGMLHSDIELAIKKHNIKGSYKEILDGIMKAGAPGHDAAVAAAAVLASSAPAASPSAPPPARQPNGAAPAAATPAADVAETPVKKRALTPTARDSEEEIGFDKATGIMPHGPRVRDAQTMLKLLDNKAMPQYGVDSVLGPETTEALEAFQKTHGVEPQTGRLDKVTQQKLVTAYQEARNKSPIGKDSPIPDEEKGKLGAKTQEALDTDYKALRAVSEINKHTGKAGNRVQPPAPGHSPDERGPH